MSHNRRTGLLRGKPRAHRADAGRVVLLLDLDVRGDALLARALGARSFQRCSTGEAGPLTYSPAPAPAEGKASRRAHQALALLPSHGRQEPEPRGRLVHALEPAPRRPPAARHCSGRHGGACAAAAAMAAGAGPQLGGNGF